MFTSVIVNIVGSVFTLVGVMIVMLREHARLALMLFISIPSSWCSPSSLPG